MKTLDLSDDAANRRTDKLLAHWCGEKEEWRILHGILCMDHAFPFDSGLDKVFNTLRIAARLDELRNEARAALKD